jgi:hypothetical protein
VPVLFSNNAQGALSTGISAVATTITLGSGQGGLFPTISGSDYCYATLVRASDTLREIVKVTARASDALTVVRGQEGTTPLAFLTGDKIGVRVTAAGIGAIQAEAAASASTASATATAASATATAASAAVTALSAAVPKLAASINALSGRQQIGTLNNLNGAAQLTAESVTLGVHALDVMASSGNVNDIAIYSRHDVLGGYHTLFNYGASSVGSICNNGSGTGINFNVTSDARRKTVVGPFDPGDLIDRINIYDFVWDTGAVGVGPLAQELFTICPTLVREGDDNPDLKLGDEGFEPWSTQITEPLSLVFAELKSLRARLAAAGL